MRAACLASVLRTRQGLRVAADSRAHHMRLTRLLQGQAIRLHGSEMGPPRHERNLGVGAAIASGYRAARETVRDPDRVPYDAVRTQW